MSEQTARNPDEIIPAEQPRGQANVMQSAEEARAIQEIQAALAVAKRFPRDTTAAIARIREACRRETLAQKAFYSYPRGKEKVTGPTVRLLEAVAQNWGNIKFGLRELSKNAGNSEVEAFAWDLETNTQETRVFKVDHARYSNEKGLTALTDPRDIYEQVANYGARRLRACLEHVIPGDVLDIAKDECAKTLAGESKGKNLKDRVANLVDAFQREFGATPDQIARYLGHPIDQTTKEEFTNLYGIYNSVKEEGVSLSSFFGKEAGDSSAAETIKKAAEEAKKEQAATEAPTEPSDAPPPPAASDALPSVGEDEGAGSDRPPPQSEEQRTDAAEQNTREESGPQWTPDNPNPNPVFPELPKRTQDIVDKHPGGALSEAVRTYRDAFAVLPVNPQEISEVYNQNRAEWGANATQEELRPLSGLKERIFKAARDQGYPQTG